jgi:hypothetical protein
MNQKILTRIATVAEKDEDLIKDDSVIVRLTLDQRIRDSLFRASNLICELEHPDIRNTPVSLGLDKVGKVPTL